MYLLIILSCFICVSANYGTVSNEGNHQIIKLNDKIPSKDWITYYDKFLVTKDMPLEIILDQNYYSVKCDSHPFESRLDIYYQIKQKDDHSYILVKDVTDYINSIWLCKLFKRDALRYITFELVVKYAKPPQMILVNRMVLPTRRWLADSDYYHKAEYYYDKGEKVDVACINPGDDLFTVELKYDVVDTKNAEQLAESSKSKFAVGFRTTLEDKNNNTFMTCTSISNDNIHIIVNITIIQHSFYDTIHFFLNQQRVKGEHVREDVNSDDLHFNYAYFLNEVNLTIDSNLYVEGVSLDLPTCYYCEKFLPIGKDARHIAYNITLSKMAKIMYFARNEVDRLTKQKAVVSFTPVNLEESNYLRINLEPENIKTELYKYENNNRKYTDYIYEYECDEFNPIKLNCSKISSMVGTFLYGNRSDPINGNSHMQYVTLIAKLHNTIFECSLKMAHQVVLSRIRILFLMKAPITTTPWIWGSTDSTTKTSIATTQIPDVEHEFPWITVVVAILTIIVLLGVCTFVYRKIQQYRLTQRETDGLYQNLQPDFDEAIPPYPTQWENNAVESGDTEENSLYNTADAYSHIRYTKPIPKCERVRKPEVIYANKGTNKLTDTDTDDLYTTLGTPSHIYADQPSSKEVSKDLYSEVLPKSVRDKKTYANVSQMCLVNTETDYVQPTYCEPLERYK